MGLYGSSCEVFERERECNRNRVRKAGKGS
jgi:hypothetical protein